MDGYTIEFYKAFWNDIKNCLFDSIAFSFNICKLTDSQYQGVITLIPNKIISKVINNRLKHLLHHLVSKMDLLKADM